MRGGEKRALKSWERSRRWLGQVELTRTTWLAGKSIICPTWIESKVSSKDLCFFFSKSLLWNMSLTNLLTRETHVLKTVRSHFLLYWPGFMTESHTRWQDPRLVPFSVDRTSLLNDNNLPAKTNRQSNKNQKTKIKMNETLEFSLSFLNCVETRK